MSSSSTDEGGFRLHVGYRRPWLTESAEFRADTTIGSDLQSARIEFRQPLSMAYGVYLSPYAEYQRRYANLYDDTGDVKITQYLMQTARAGRSRPADWAPRRFPDRPRLRDRARFADLPFDDGSGRSLLWPSFTSQALTARARLVIDQLDDPLFPRKGYFTELRIERSLVSRNGRRRTSTTASTARRTPRSTARRWSRSSSAGTASARRSKAARASAAPT